MLRLWLLPLLCLLLPGCSTYAAHRYSISADTVVALRSLNGKTLNVGPFASSQPGLSEIPCRAVGPIKTPDGEPFADFIRKALIDELQMANAFSTAAPVTLTGNLHTMDFNSMAGHWDLALTVYSSSGQSATVAEHYAYKTSYDGGTGCNQTAQAFMPAVQNLIGKLVSAPEFHRLLQSP